jgi:hypothetical protein
MQIKLMQIKLEGKTCVLSVTITRWKAFFVMLALCLVIGLPIHSCNSANQRLATMSKNESVRQIKIIEPVVSPYTLSHDAKLTLNAWLLYGVEHGYDDMIRTYQQTTQNKKEYTPFQHIIETEWRLGDWASVKPIKPFCLYWVLCRLTVVAQHLVPEQGLLVLWQDSF